MIVNSLIHVNDVEISCLTGLSPVLFSHYTHRTTKLLGGYIGFTPSVRLSVRPSRVRPASRVRSVASTVLVESISYLYIL